MKGGGGLPNKNLAESFAKGSSEIFKPVMENTLKLLKMLRKMILQIEVTTYTMDDYIGSSSTSAVEKTG